MKIQNSLHHTHLLTTVEQLRDFKGTITCDHPNEVLSTFKGKIQIEGEHKEHPLSAKQQLLHGACLKNTTFVWGVVVYTGRDTKLMKNLRYVCLFFLLLTIYAIIQQTTTQEKQS